MQPWLKKADPYPPNEKLRVCGAVREHCKDAKLLELHMGSPQLREADPHLSMGEDHPRELIDEMENLTAR